MNNVKYNSAVFILLGIFLLPAGINICKAAQEYPLYAGWASVDITPEKPVNLIGQMSKRISQSVLDPLTATVLALETRGENGEKEQAIMISCDLLWTRKAIQEKLQESIKSMLPDFDVTKLFINATHTHTGPGVLDGAFYGLYDVSTDEGVMKASEYADFLLKRLSKVTVEAWRSRKPAGVSWALGHSVVGHNRRAVSFDGKSAMYGDTSQDNFSNIEGYEDHGQEMLFFWDENQKLTGIVINIACPSQETEGMHQISADFWHEVREKIRTTYSRDLFIFPQCAAAGDQSPHLLWRKKAEDIMLQRRGTSRRQEIARRIAKAVDDVLPYARKDIKNKLVFVHAVARINLPTEESPNLPFYTFDSVKPAEIHVVRLGDVALATNPFELYLDYGVRMKARSKAVLTFIVQLSCRHSGYLPTERASKGGGYSAVKYVVGPEGGQALVNETIRLINDMWD
ncbi:MAG: hypothetical protein WAV28_17580 [Sedimentisphaerales bacterium]